MSKHKKTLLCLTIACSITMRLAHSSQELKVFDTMTNFESPLSSSQLSNKAGWREIEGDNIAGDLCVESSRMIIMLRKGSVGPEVYYKIGARSVWAATLSALGLTNSHTMDMESFQIVDQAENGVLIRIVFRTAAQEQTDLTLFCQADQPTVDVRRGKGTHRISIKAQNRYIIMPDLFADDLVFDLQETQTDALLVPEDNHFLLQMIDNGDAIIACKWLSSDTEIAVVPDNDSGEEPTTQTTVSFNNNQKIWISILADKGIWHKVDAKKFNIHEHTRLDWTVPFPAYWRINYQRADRRGSGLTDSFWNAETHSDGTFELVPNLLNMEIADGRYLVADPDRQKRLVRRSVMNQHTGAGWWTYRGWFIQPFYVDGNKAFIRLPKFDKRRTIRYAGPIVIYPLLSADSDCTQARTVEDLLRNNLGEDYLDMLDLADLNRRPEKDHYPPTCPTTEYCEKIFEQNEELLRKDHIMAIMAEMNLFVENMRERIQQYVDWEQDMQRLYHDSRNANPTLTTVIDRIAEMTGQIAGRFKAVKTKIRTPQRVLELSDKAVGLIDYNGRAQVTRFKKTCKQIRSVGDAQDELLGQLRDIVEITRQKVSLMHAQEKDPAVRRFLRLVRAKTQEMLRIRYDMEGK
jgi:hypothetical protein